MRTLLWGALAMICGGCGDISLSTRAPITARDAGVGADSTLDPDLGRRPDSGNLGSQDMGIDTTVDQQISLDIGVDTTVDQQLAPDTGVDTTVDSSTGGWSQATVFVTDAAYTGNFGGHATADSACRSAAALAGLPSANAYLAIVSTAALSARDRLPLAGPIYRTDGLQIAANAADLWDGEIAHRINLAADGTATSNVLVWTGSDPDGSTDTGSSNCSNWSTTSGAADTGRTDADGALDCGRWVSIYGGAGCQAPPYPNSSNACSNPGAFYCIGPRP